MNIAQSVADRIKSVVDGRPAAEAANQTPPLPAETSPPEPEAPSSEQAVAGAQQLADATEIAEGDINTDLPPVGDEQLTKALDVAETSVNKAVAGRNDVTNYASVPLDPFRDPHIASRDRESQIKSLAIRADDLEHEALFDIALAQSVLIEKRGFRPTAQTDGHYTVEDRRIANLERRLETQSAATSSERDGGLHRLSARTYSGATVMVKNEPIDPETGIHVVVQYADGYAKQMHVPVRDIAPFEGRADGRIDGHIFLEGTIDREWFTSIKMVRTSESGELIPAYLN